MGSGVRPPRVPTATREAARGSLAGSSKWEKEKGNVKYYTYSILIVAVCGFVEGEFEGDVYILNVRAQLRLVNR